MAIKDTTPERHLHVICFDVPYPVDYGGVFDLFYHLTTFYRLGIHIHLHCFEYGRGRQAELNKYCVEVYYYPRKKNLKTLLGSVPYIVASRANTQLLQNLQKDNYPVLMHGMHSTYYLHKGQLPGHRCFVRLCNVEHQYYAQLAHSAPFGIKKMYFLRESRLLKKYEASLANKANFWTLTEKDMDTMATLFGYKSIDYLPLYLPDYHSVYKPGMGGFCLYHGNLSVPENEQAAIWLIEKIFNQNQLPLVIAGKKPTKALESLIKNNKNTCLIANPSHAELQDLIEKAQVHVLPSMNTTGIKLKLINALYNGRHCVVNQAGADGSGLEKCCTIANSAKAMQDAVNYLFTLPFTPYTYNTRMQLLSKLYSNQANASQMISWIFEGRKTEPGAWLAHQKEAWKA